jgi:sarcosine oxidase subunit beta
MGRNPSRAAREQVDVSVIGAGVVGLSVALHLVESGLRVRVFERTTIGAGASGVQPGGVRQQWGTRANCLMAKESFEFYRDFPTRYDTMARARLDNCGYVFAASEEASLQQLKANIAVQHKAGIPSELLTPEQAAELVPSLNPSQIVGAAYCAEDGYFDRPQAVVQALAEIVSPDAPIEINGVRRLERNSDGWALHLDDGRSHLSEHVVVATGYQSDELLAPLGHALPIAKEPRYLFYSEHIHERLLEPLVIAVDLGLAAKHLADGRVLASDLHASGSPEENQSQWRRRIHEVVVDLLPILEYVPLPIMAEGFYDMTPDGQPIIDVLEDGLCIAAGFSGHGFMVAPSAGMLVTALINGSERPEWAGAVSAARFANELTQTEAQVI